MNPRSGKRLGAGAALALLVLAITAPVSAAHPSRSYWHHHHHHLRLSLHGSPGVVNVGQQITYAATITNNGPGTASTAGFQDELPGKATLDSANPSQGSCNGNPTLECNLGSLAPSASATVTITVTANQPGPLVNRGWISGNPPSGWHDQHIVTSYARSLNPNLDLHLNGSPGVVNVGQQITYAATITNNGPGTASTAGFQDELPGKATLDSANPSQGSCNGNPTLECNLGSLAPSASATVTITVTANQPGPLVNRGWISGNPPSGWHDQHIVTSYARSLNPNLDLHLNGSPGVVNVGQQITYTATITNNGPGTASTAGFQDELPGKATLDSANPSQGSCNGNPTLECNLGSLAPSASATVTITVTANQPGPLVNRGWISGNPPSGWHDQHIVTSYARSLNPNLDLHLNGSPGVVNVGQQITYTATITNNGPGTASTAGFQDELPGKATLDSANPSQGSCNGNPTLECNLGSLAPSASATVTITVTANQPGPLVNRGWISGNPPSGWHDQHIVTSYARSLNPNLDLHLNGSPGVVNVGQQITYTATITNNGPGTASTAGFQDELPGKATLDSANPSQGSCNGNPTLECNLGSLAPSASATVTITVTANQPGPLVNRGWISGNPPSGWHDQHIVTSYARNAQGPVTPTTTTATTTTATTTVTVPAGTTTVSK